MTATAKPKPRKYTAERGHPSYIIEPCPKCDFPEADGGYCPDCGQTFRSTVIDRRSKGARR